MRRLAAVLLGGVALALWAGGPLGAQEPAQEGPLGELAELVAEHGAPVAGDPAGVTAARLRLSENSDVRPQDRVFFGFNYFDNVRLAPPATLRSDPAFERSFLDTVAFWIPYPSDPLGLSGPRDEFGPYWVVGDGPVYEGGGPSDPNFGKNRGINAFRGSGGWVTYSTVYDGSFTNVPTGTHAFLRPGTVLLLIPFDEVTGWEQVTIRTPDDAVEVDVNDLPELVIEVADGGLVVAGVDEPEDEPAEEPTAEPVEEVIEEPAAVEEQDVEDEPAPAAATGPPWALLIALVIGGGLVGLWWWWAHNRPDDDDPCAREKRAWQEAEDFARHAADNATVLEESAARLEEVIAGLKADLAAGQLSGDGKALIHEHEWQAGNRHKEAEDARANADAERRNADQRHREFLECAGLAPPPGADQGAAPATATAGPAVAIATGPEHGGPCTATDPVPPPEEVSAAPLGPLDVDCILRFTPVGVSPAKAKKLALELNKLGGEVGKATTVLGLGLGAKGAATGKPGQGAASIGGFAADVPTSPLEAAGKVLELTAKLGAMVAGKVGEWQGKNKHREVQVEALLFAAVFTLTWNRVWVCRDGVWECGEELTVEEGPLQQSATYNYRKTVSAGDLKSVMDRVIPRIQAALDGSMAKLKEATAADRRPCG